MKLIKKINNNFALAEDSRGDVIIVEGKGIGFQKMPCELTDLKLITRTYYDFEEGHMKLLTEIPYKVMTAANIIHQYIVQKISCPLNPNLPFIMADHINFSIQRFEKNIFVKIPMYHDLQHLYPLEFEIAAYGLKVIKKELGVSLPQEEIFGIAMNIINAQMNFKSADAEEVFQRWCDNFSSIIEKSMDITISKESFSYSRFVSHIRYLYQRIKEGKGISSDNIKMYQSLREQFPDIYECVLRINRYLKEEEHVILDDEENLYLMLHINRLCDTVDCNRKGITPGT